MRVLSHLVPRSGAEADWERSVNELGDELRALAEGDALQVGTLLRLEDDPFGPGTPYRACIEITGADLSPDRAAALLEGVGERIERFAHPDFSTALLGEDVLFIESGPTPVRYQYLMRRNAAFGHADYLRRYREVHSRFGLETPGIEGYTQLHVDTRASRQLAGAAGLGIWGVDSVSELHLASVEHFLGEVAKSSIGADAGADEEVFVDRARSFDLCCAVSAPS